jgi:hypothetical protein
MSVKPLPKDGRNSLATLSHVSSVSSTQNNSLPTSSGGGATTDWLTELGQALRCRSSGIVHPTSRELIVVDPSFNLSFPRGPGGQSTDGIPNLNSPSMRDKYRRRVLNNPNGQEQLPPFVKPA